NIMLKDKREKENRDSNPASRGFTLVEVLVALSLFIIIMTVSMTSIVGVFDANRKSRSLKTVINNLNLAVESMAKEMRFGMNYHCGSSGTLTSPQSCPSGSDFISFLSSDDEQISYRFSEGRIEREVDSGGYIPVTAPEIA